MTYASRTTNVPALLLVFALSGSSLAQGPIVLRATCQGAGKSFNSTFRSIGNGQFVIETTVD